MNRKDTINKLRQLSPVITFVTATSDMGYEFSAVVPGGVIYSEPGMLLSYSGGEWPPDQWDDKTDVEYEELLRGFLLDETWQITAWEDLSDKEIEQWFDDVLNSDFYRSSDKHDESSNSYEKKSII